MCSLSFHFFNESLLVTKGKKKLPFFYALISIYYIFIWRYGAIVMDDQYDDGSLGYTVLHNSSCQHAAPTYINLMNSAILRLATENENMKIQTRNYPLPMTRSQHSQHHVCYNFFYKHFSKAWDISCSLLIHLSTWKLERNFCLLFS